jgi:electron transfer flavoprotein alpha subunit
MGATADAADEVVHALASQAEPGFARFVFSSNETFSGHVARLLAARLGVGLAAPLAGLHDVARTAGALQVVLVDDRYFFARPTSQPVEPLQANRTAQAAFIDLRVPPGHAPLEEAELVFSAGDGVSDLQRFVQVAKSLGAAVGATKVLCDKGLLPRRHQVGSSGTTVAPRVYVAFGISGSRQHLQGIAPSTKVVAVNIDANAPIMRRAELGIVADADLVLSRLGEAVGARP